MSSLSEEMGATSQTPRHGAVMSIRLPREMAGGKRALILDFRLQAVLCLVPTHPLLHCPNPQDRNNGRIQPCLDTTCQPGQTAALVIHSTPALLPTPMTTMQCRPLYLCTLYSPVFSDEDLGLDGTCSVGMQQDRFRENLNSHPLRFAQAGRNTGTAMASFFVWQKSSILLLNKRRFPSKTHFRGSAS